VKPSRPSAVLTLDGRALTSAEAALVRLRLALSVGEAHDAAEITIAPASPLASATPGAQLEVALGEKDAEETVWTGEVTDVAATERGTVLAGLAATVALSRERRSQTWLSQSVADIVRDLAGPVSVDTVDAPLRLEAYSVDDRRPVWDHLVTLARLAGCDLSAAASGGLRFVPSRSAAGPLPLPLPGGDPLRYGANVLGWRVTSRTPLRAADAVALGAASEQGAERWHWLRNEPAPGAGQGTEVRVVAALRTRDAAQAVTDALSARAGRSAVRGEVTAVGRPAVRPGDQVEVQDLPTPAGPLRVLAVEHRFDGRAGFITRLSVEGV
jgi:phage protein D